MKISMSVDGLPRADFKLTARLTLYDLGVFLTCHLMNKMDYLMTYEETKNTHSERIKKQAHDIINKMSVKEIKETIEEIILTYGTENPAYRVGDENLNDLCDYVTSLIAKKFKGFTK